MTSTSTRLASVDAAGQTATQTTNETQTRTASASEVNEANGAANTAHAEQAYDSARMQAQTGQKPASLLRLIQPLRPPLKRHRLLLALTIVAGWGKFSAPLAVPWIFGRVLDLLVHAPSAGQVAGGAVMSAAAADAQLLHYGIALSLLIVVVGIATYYRSALAQRLTAIVQHHLRQRLFFHMQRLSVSFFHRHHAGALGARVSSDINNSAVILNRGLIQWAMDVPSFVLAATLMFSINWPMALGALVILSCNGFIILKLGPQIRVQRKEIQERQSTVTGCAAEYFAGISVVKAYAGEAASDTKFRRSSKYVRDAQVFNARIQGRFQAFTSSLVLITQGLVVFVGAYLIIHYPQSLTFGSLVAFMLYIGNVNGSVQRLTDSMMELQDGVAALDRINDIYSIMPTPAEVANPLYPSLHGNIRFDQVDFSYKAGEPVLNNFTYNFEAGKSYALVGPSGGGKSTITQLMLRFYDPNAGEITVDGHPLKKLAKQHYNSQVAVVLQDPIIFSGSVADNIGFAESEVDMERIRRAAAEAQAAEFIDALPDGYESRLGERGVALSGGQRQRIAIARALMRDPALLILDEATSALDTVTERAIQEVTDKLHGTRTMVVIAHRLSTIRKVDKILVIQKGRLVEEGTYEDLIAHGGHFAELAEEQSSVES